MAQNPNFDPSFGGKQSFVSSQPTNKAQGSIPGPSGSSNLGLNNQNLDWSARPQSFGTSGFGMDTYPYQNPISSNIGLGSQTIGFQPNLPNQGIYPQYPSFGTRVPSLADLIFQETSPETIKSAMDLLCSKLSRLESKQYTWGLASDINIGQKSSYVQVTTASLQSKPLSVSKPSLIYQHKTVNDPLPQVFGASTMTSPETLRVKLEGNDDFVIVKNPPVKGNQRPEEIVFQSAVNGFFYNHRGERIHTTGDGYLRVFWDNSQKRVFWALFPKRTPSGPPQGSNPEKGDLKLDSSNLIKLEEPPSKPSNKPKSKAMASDYRDEPQLLDAVKALAEYRRQQGYKTIINPARAKDMSAPAQITTDKDGKPVLDDDVLNELIANVRNLRQIALNSSLEKIVPREETTKGGDNEEEKKDK